MVMNKRAVGANKGVIAANQTSEGTTSIKSVAEDKALVVLRRLPLARKMFFFG